MTETVLSSRDDVVTTVTLNRPEKMNALSSEMVDALFNALETATTDGTRLLVFQANGKGFSGGFDFTGIENKTDADLLARFVRLELLLQAVHHAPFATMALAHGACYGAAADLVSSCQHRIALPGTRFRMPGLQFGIALGTRRLAELTGKDNARYLLEPSRVFKAEEAFQRKFLTHIAERQEWSALIENAMKDATTLPSDAHRLLMQQTVPDHRNADLAALVRSASTPGLRDRIADYIASVKAGRK